MYKKVKKKKSGRKQIVIDWQKVNMYLRAGCNGAAIARLMGYHEETLYNAVKRKYKLDFSVYRTQKMEEGVSLVEGTIFKDALEKGGADRMFWLKNRAKWADRQKIEHTGIPKDINITVDDSETAKLLKSLKDEFSKIN